AQIPTEGLIGFYQLDGNTMDESGLEHNGTKVGLLSSTEGRNGEENGALLFNGGYIDLGNPSAFQMTESISISAWINPSEINGWQAIASKWSGFDLDGYYLGINPEGNVVRWNLDIPNPVESGAVEINKWTHIVATHDGELTKLYVNGVLVEEMAYNKPIVNNDANVYIGSQFNFPDESTFRGAMDEILFYNRALSDSEVLEIFNFLPTSVKPLESSSLDLILYPNPTTEFLYLQNNSETDIVSYQIVNLEGKVMKSGVYDQQGIDLISLTPSVYCVLLELDGIVLSKKFILK
ncbi:T9SS type A sorting domain-containing protein, partial [Saprospiraceae bacterium]|nr:T9SS type A sorting domain-containing protein [Saprospiraceae bacterium]